MCPIIGACDVEKTLNINKYISCWIYFVVRNIFRNLNEEQCVLTADQDSEGAARITYSNGFTILSNVHCVSENNVFNNHSLV